MAEMEKLKQGASEVARIADVTRRRQREGAIATKTFEQLTPPEKDILLKAIGVKLGLIVDSDDS